MSFQTYFHQAVIWVILLPNNGVLVMNSILQKGVEGNIWPTDPGCIWAQFEFLTVTKQRKTWKSMRNKL